MATLKFDGRLLKDGARVIANVQGNNIREGNGARVIANIKVDYIRKGSSSLVIFNIKGADIRQGSGASRIATMKDVNSAIEGPGKVVKAALWLCCVR